MPKIKAPARGRGGVMRMQYVAQSCPYFRNTWRHELLIRQLCAASVAPQRSRLLQVIPPEWSHSRAAAGLHGASSARSIAPALVVHTPSNRQAASIVLMRKKSLVFCWKGLCVSFRRWKIQPFCASHKCLDRRTLFCLLNPLEEHNNPELRRVTLKQKPAPNASRRTRVARRLGANLLQGAAASNTAPRSGAPRPGTAR